MASDEIPPAARAGVSKGAFAGTVIVVAIIALVAGMALDRVLYPAPAEGGPLATLVIGTNTPFPPFEYRDDNDNIVGFDIDLIKEVMERMGRSYEIVNYRDFGALLTAVGGGTIDVAASSITIRADRNATMDFTDPYFESDQAVLVRAGFTALTCAASVCTAGDLDGFSIATQAGTTSEYWVADNVPGASANLTTFPDVTQVLQALQTSAVDLVVIDKPAGDGIVAQNPTTFKLAGAVETNELYGFAVANNDPSSLVAAMNVVLRDIRSDGTYDDIVDRWF